MDTDIKETNCPVPRKGKTEQEKVEAYLLKHIRTPSGVGDSLTNDLEKSETKGFSVLEKSYYINFCIYLILIFNKCSLGNCFKP